MQGACVPRLVHEKDEAAEEPMKPDGWVGEWEGEWVAGLGGGMVRLLGGWMGTLAVGEAANPGPRGGAPPG